MSDNWYDTAQICIEGHVINSCSVKIPEHNKKFCDKCGAPTITNCQNCDASIKGYYHQSNVMALIYHTDLPLPSFCPDCGSLYPWTEAKLKAAKDLSDELENLSLEERDLLKKSIDDIVRDTPQTPVATTRFKKLVAKAGPVAADMYREILLPLLSEAIKKQIWP